MADHSHGAAAGAHGTPGTPAAHDVHAHEAHAHGAHAHGAHTHGAHGHAAHGHADAAGDKAAAFLGLIGGLVAIGGLLYGMVTWTNSRYAHEGGAEKTAAESTR